MKAYFLFIIGISGISFLHAQKQFEIRYMGNMGIAISHNDSTIIIDGLHDFYDDAYLPTDESAVKAMLQKQIPYKKIIAIAVTHRHSDHFDSTLITDVANVHTSAVLLGGAQTRSLLSQTLQPKFRMVTNNITLRINGTLIINLWRIPHTYAARHASVENYRVEIIWNGFRVVHLGDADVKNDAIGSLQDKPDVMVVPNWFLSNEGVKLLETLKPVRLLVTHVSPADNTIFKHQKLKSEIITFRKYGDQIKI